MTLSTTAFFILIAAAVIQTYFLFSRTDSPDPFSHYLLLVSSLLLIAEFVLRSISIRFPAITNMYESLVFLSAMLCAVLFLARLRSPLPGMKGILPGGTILVLLLLAIASSPLAPAELNPPIPALQSGWLVLHVTFAFIGESFFAVAFVASLIYLFSKDNIRKMHLDRITYLSIGIGYPVFTMGALIFGAIWAQYAWGRWWGWDPKETWALVTWLVYTAYLHVRFLRKGSRTLSAVLSVAGFLATLFTFFGVNYLLSGLHSYV